jgi:hypothetical protein
VSTPVFLNEDFQNRSKFGYQSWEEALRRMGSKGYAEAKNKGDRFAADTDPGLMQWFGEQQGSSDVEVLIAMQKARRAYRRHAVSGAHRGARALDSHRRKARSRHPSSRT